MNVAASHTVRHLGSSPQSRGVTSFYLAAWQTIIFKLGNICILNILVKYSKSKELLGIREHNNYDNCVLLSRFETSLFFLHTIYVWVVFIFVLRVRPSGLITLSYYKPIYRLGHER